MAKATFKKVLKESVMHGNIELGFCPVKNITTDKSFNRALHRPHVNDIVASFDPLSVGTLLLVYAMDRLIVLDGQYRLTVLQEREVEEVPVQVLHALSTAEICRVFWNVNRRRLDVRADTLYDFGLRAGFLEQRIVCSESTRAGFRVPRSVYHDVGMPNRIVAHAALGHIASRYREAGLRRTFELIKGAFVANVKTNQPMDRTIQAGMLRGMALFLNNYGHVSADTIAKRFKQLKLRPAAVHDEVRARQYNACSCYDYVDTAARTLADAYESDKWQLATQQRRSA